MAVVVFDPAAFKLAFPQFANAADGQLTALFTMIGFSLIDNTDGSIVVNVDQRAAMMNLLMAHLLTLFGYTTATGTVTPGTGAVGRVASATEGTVSTSLGYNVPAGASEAWYSQTPYGAMYWVMTAPFRSFHYVAAGRSGIGRSVDYLSTGIGIQTRLANNSGTPDGV